AIDSVGTLTMTSVHASGTGTIASNGNITGTGGSDYNLEAAGTIDVGIGGLGMRSPNMPARVFPDASTIFNQYTAASMGGTTVSFDSVPVSGTPAITTHA